MKNITWTALIMLLMMMNSSNDSVVHEPMQRRYEAALLHQPRHVLFDDKVPDAQIIVVTRLSYPTKPKRKGWVVRPNPNISVELDSRKEL